ncbi:type VI secretion system-associated protein TagF [Duganella sp. FT94W]|uniref:Type VI secretion system-associated protein TagF n=1 Tax=Duganella lactea TaxID=2692173 RepID=A0ABW9V893_9BURK|nr:type VI secretion system-associated protein TagF [Duganella lactea]MYM35750.1 type VI secretion system-associated protein TagF [Duganella lactea]
MRRDAPGFFGKIPSHGDFVARRLPPTFTGPWDAWLQAGMADSRARLGDAWLPVYLDSPIWRFALGAGVCGPQACYGVMMPSVDRVGRYFPFTIAAAGRCRAPAAAWYAALEALALAALAAELSPQHHDAALLALAAAPADAGAEPALSVREFPEGVRFWRCDDARPERAGPVLYQDWLAAPLFTELLQTQ